MKITYSCQLSCRKSSEANVKGAPRNVFSTTLNQLYLVMRRFCKTVYTSCNASVLQVILQVNLVNQINVLSKSICAHPVLFFLIVSLRNPFQLDLLGKVLFSGRKALFYTALPSRLNIGYDQEKTTEAKQDTGEKISGI